MLKDSWDPDQYEKFKAERSQPFYDLADLLKPIKKSVVVDLGCGTGELTAVLHRRLGALTTLGIDSSAQMLASATQYVESGLSFRRGDIRDWNAQAEFDTVFSNAALQWVPDHPELFSRIRAALRPGGQVAVQMPINQDYPTHALARTMAREWASQLGQQILEDMSHLLAPEKYAEILFQVGFIQQMVSVRVYGHILQSREDVIEWVKGTLLNRFKSRLEPDEFAKFSSEYRERLFLELPDQRPFFYPFKRILIWGQLGAA